MMQFALICRDAPDALERRLSLRAEHLLGVHDLKRGGRIVDGGAILDETGTMIGSIVLCDFADRTELDAWLEKEPFVIHKVWAQVEIVPFQRVDWNSRSP